MELTPIIIYSIEEVFAGSVLMSMTPGDPYDRTEVPTSDSMTGVITFNGCATGYAAIHMSNEMAKVITQDFLFFEDLEITEEVIHDTICEVTNILAGRIKSYIDPPGSNLRISLPELSLGNNFLPEPLPEANKVTIPFNLDEGEFWVEVQLSQ